MKRKINQQLTLKPQDLVVLLKLISLGKNTATYGDLAASLGMSSSEVHASIGRARAARLINMEDDRPVVIRAAFKEFLLHGAKYAFPATLGPPTCGVPTAYAAPPLASRITQPNDLPPVWPDPQGERRRGAGMPKSAWTRSEGMKSVSGKSSSPRRKQRAKRDTKANRLPGKTKRPSSKWLRNSYAARWPCLPLAVATWNGRSHNSTP